MTGERGTLDERLARLIFGMLSRLIDRTRVRWWSPTRDWPSRSVSHLSYDMRQRTLNGVPIGAPMERLQFLGPADSFDNYHPWLTLYYYGLGLIVTVLNGQLHSFEVLLDPGLCPDLSRHRFARGTLVLSNHEAKTTSLTCVTSVAEVVHLFGQPVETGPVAGQTAHTFVTANHHFLTTHEPGDGRLLRIDLINVD